MIRSELETFECVFILVCALVTLDQRVKSMAFARARARYKLVVGHDDSSAYRFLCIEAYD